MALDTYANLQSAIITWAMRDGEADFAAAVPDFITGCEQLINYGAQSSDALRTSDMETSVTLTPDANGICTLPTDYLTWRRVTANTSPLRDLELVAADWANHRYPISDPGNPKFFFIKGSSLYIVPGCSSTVTLDYYQKIPALSDANPTNWLLSKAPMIYLYGSLMQAAPFMMDDSRLATWGKLFSEATAGFNASDDLSNHMRSVQRVRGYTP